MTEVSLFRHTAILIKYRAKRILNRFANFQRKKTPSTERTATQPKSTKAWLLAMVFMPYMLLSSFFLGDLVITQTLAKLNQREHFVSQEYFPAWHCDKMNETFTYKKRTGVCIPANLTANTIHVSRRAHRALTIILFTVFLSVLFFGLSQKNMAKSDEDFEWLSTLPVSKKNLILIKFLEESILNVNGFAFFFPLIVSIAYQFNPLSISIVMALLSYIPVILICSMFQVFLQLGLKLFLPLSRLKNITAFISLIAIVPMFLVISIIQSNKPFMLTISSYASAWHKWTPFGLAVDMVTAMNLKIFFVSGAYLFLEAGLIYYVLAKSLNSLLSRGVSGKSHQETDSRDLTSTTSPRPSFFSHWLTPLQKNDLVLLFRDTSFMSRTLLMPILIIGFNFFNFASGTELFSFSPRLLSLLSTVSLYSFMFSLIPILTTENQTFWLAKTFPISLVDFFQQKIKLWIAVSLACPLALSIYLILNGAPLSYQICFSLISIVAFTITGGYIAASLGIIGVNPYNETVGFGKIRVIYVYSYMALIGMVGSSIYKNEVGPILVTFIISYQIAKALWQKVAQQLPYILDSVAIPIALITQLDGIVAASVFFILQTLFSLGLTLFISKNTEQIPFIAFTLAGFMTCLAAAIIYWKENPRNFPVLFNKKIFKSLCYGILGGVLASVIGLSYLNWTIDFNYFTEARSAEVVKNSIWLFVAIVFAAPLFEEYIFRGLLFNGLRQDRKRLYSIVTSALLFAIIHPVISVAPVFVLGLLTAVAYELTGSLLASILIHAIYNFAMFTLNQL